MFEGECLFKNNIFWIFDALQEYSTRTSLGALKPNTFTLQYNYASKHIGPVHKSNWSCLSCLGLFIKEAKILINKHSSWKPQQRSYMHEQFGAFICSPCPTTDSNFIKKLLVIHLFLLEAGSHTSFFFLFCLFFSFSIPITFDLYSMIDAMWFKVVEMHISDRKHTFVA